MKTNKANNGLKISEAEYDLPNSKKKGKIAVLMYLGECNPKEILDYAVGEYVQDNGYHEFIDAHLDNPWTRVIISDINNIEQQDFDVKKHKL